MSSRYAYEYAIVRVVPRVEREEFVNVGAILYSRDGRFLDIKYTLDKKRLICLFPEIDLQQLEIYLSGWKSICKGGEAGGPIGVMDSAFRFRWLVANKSTIIQTSRPHPGKCDDIQKRLEEIYQRYVD